MTLARHLDPERPVVLERLDGRTNLTRSLAVLFSKRDRGARELPRTLRNPLTPGLRLPTPFATDPSTVLRETIKPDITVHLGDVSYSGRIDEFQNFFIPENCWPRGTLGLSRVPPQAHGTYILNGNHEMYSGCEGYFGVGLKAYNQANEGASGLVRGLATSVGPTCSPRADWERGKSVHTTKQIAG